MNPILMLTFFKNKLIVHIIVINYQTYKGLVETPAKTLFGPAGQIRMYNSYLYGVFRDQL